jgi:hypothetical protein
MLLKYCTFKEQTAARVIRTCHYKKTDIWEEQG